ncbi:MAG: Fic family protein [Candidatus Nomurabacteria bacterium]|jgi:Fic family protein|nr:Fic family protein [Candidatus Nomurabacteria bacterium]
MNKLKMLSPLPTVDFDQFNKKIIAIREKIGVLKGACYGLPNPQLLLSPAVLRESLESSEIENIVTTLANVLQAQLFPEAERSANDKEVLRYNAALHAGMDEMKKRYFGSNTIRTVHATLVPSEPNFRTTQNELRNARTNEVVYTPPPANAISGYLSDLEKFINNEENGLDPIIKTVITHYQFESIHPFGDGNGRTGRILIVLCLIHFGLLDLPVLFISEYINNHKKEYYDTIRNVTDSGDWVSYISYMLDAFLYQAEKSTQLLLTIKELHDTTKRLVREKLPKIYSRDLIDAIFNQPFITPTRYSTIMKVSYQTGSKHLKQLEKIGVMKSVKLGKYLLFANVKLMEQLNSGNS